MMALTGPVRQVDTAPTKAETIGDGAAADRDGVDRRGVAGGGQHGEPWPFCTTSTVMASGTTSSAIAVHENCGTCSAGAAMQAGRL